MTSLTWSYGLELYKLGSGNRNNRTDKLTCQYPKNGAVMLIFSGIKSRRNKISADATEKTLGLDVCVLPFRNQRN